MRFAMRIMQIICYSTVILGLITSVVTIMLLYQSVPEVRWQGIIFRQHLDNLYTASVWPKMVIVFADLLRVYAFFRLAQLFTAFVRRQYFVEQTVKHMKAFAWLFLVTYILERGVIVHEWIRSGGGNFSITSEDMLGPMLCLTFLIIAHVLNEARKNTDELGDYF